ncbi:c-x8-c-x5-c-x3-h type zinc finger protein [Lasallia pustulata]|uniref:C-x8-c-x5-c-x3-h type zinc finger protein n=1 Tax=Lasallia pustulata TaxID=136370 RepID=A0A1W5CZV0_9LECA|nr:c-x8-c-x5-c-x3-h type zinc finger protein [Lasallia pustulata]
MIRRPDTSEDNVNISNGGIKENNSLHIQPEFGVQTSFPNTAELVMDQGGQQVNTWRQGVSGSVDEIQATVDAIVNAASRNGAATATANATTTATATNSLILPNKPSSYTLLQATPPSANIANTRNPTLLLASSAPPATTPPTTLATLPLPNPNPTSSVPTRKKKEKVYCSFWIRRGECDYTQQGCLYKHEMPTDRETLKELGISIIPRWWREANAVRVGGSGWNERAGLGIGKEKERGMWRAGVAGKGAQGLGAEGQGIQELGPQGPPMQMPPMLPPPHSKGTEGMRTMVGAQLGGQLFLTAAHAAPVAVTPAASPVGLAFPRQTMGSRYSPPATTSTPVPAVTSSPSSALAPAPAPAPAYRQHYAPATLDGRSVQSSASSPVGVAPTGSRLSPPSPAVQIPESSATDGTPAESTAPTSAPDSGNVSTSQSIPIPSTPTSTQTQSSQLASSPPGPMHLPTYQPLTPSPPVRHTSSFLPAPVPQPKPLQPFDISNAVSTPPLVHRRLFVTPGQSQFVTAAPAESGSGTKVTSQNEGVKQRNQKPKAGQKDEVLVEFGEG